MQNSVTPALRTAVIGTGYLGKFHAQKYAAIDGCTLVAVADANPDTARAIADPLNTRAVSDYRELLGEVDAVSIATPTRTHFEVASAFLAAGVHVLVEKPVTVTPEEAAALVKLAAEKQCVLQVGHLERFNTALRAVEDKIDQPLFIESHRLAPFTPRGADVNVVLDLMIHDIDIILSIVRSDVADIQASGATVISDATDIANARLTFANGCVANVTASRISDKQERRMRLFQKNRYIAVDFLTNQTKVCETTGTASAEEGLPGIHCEDNQLQKGDAILAEISAFCEAIREAKAPLVSGEDGLRALETATRISALLS
ncbi:Gfo/Idh/MocA family oxidoreductase [Granulosicoccaceae sp. 1_MG-2023]|nr:Gfo/Idh/MocA family oxidoreductase [Granulosicoccaceae sp. 1_MG-2023]